MQQEQSNTQPDLGAIPDSDDIFLTDPTLQNPDIPNNDKFQFDDEIQELILGAMLQDKDFLGFAADIVKPTHFTVKGASNIAEVAIEFWQKFKMVPGKAILQAELKQRHKGAKSLTLYLAMLNKVIDYGYDLYPMGYLREQCTAFAKIQSLRRLHHRFLDQLKEGKRTFDELHVEYVAEVDKLNAMQVSGDVLGGFDAEEFFNFAETEKREWLLDNWIAEGSIHLFAGAKKIGKSTLVHSLIPALVTGQEWFGSVPVTQCNVLYVDLENPVDYIRDNLLQSMPRDQWRNVSDRLSIPKNRPAAITGEWLKQYMEANSLIGKKGVIFIDSGFAAFNKLFEGTKRVWENTGSDVRTAIKPLEQVARDTGWAVVLIHHDNKAGDTGGSTQWEASVDYVWHYEAKGEKRHLEAKHGRWVQEKPATIVFEKPGSRLELSGTASQIKATHYQEKVTDDLAAVFSEIPAHSMGTTPTEANTITAGEIIANTGMGKNKVRDILGDLVKTCQICADRLGDNKSRNAPVRYWQVTELQA